MFLSERIKGTAYIFFNNCAGWLEYLWSLKIGVLLLQRRFFPRVRETTFRCQLASDVNKEKKQSENGSGWLLQRIRAQDI